MTRFAAALLAVIFCAAAGAFARDIQPELSDEIIFNPGTGWQMCTTAGPEEVRKCLEEMPLVSVYYYRTVWTEYEPAKEKYEGSPAVSCLDKIRDYVKAKNRYFAFRAVSYNSKAPGYSRMKVNGCESAVPPYLYEELGAKGFEEPGGAKNWVPCFWDEVYIERFNKLAEFLGKRYSGESSVAYVDIGGGNWGEMNLRNTGVPELDSLQGWRDHGLTPESWHNMIVKLVDGYTKSFSEEQVIVASDFGSYGKGEETTNYAISHNVGFRDDGLGMDYSRAGKTNPAFEKNWPKVMCLYENGYVDWTDASGPGWGNADAVRSTLDWAINTCHASIVMVGKGQGAPKAYKAYEPLVKEFGKKLGYRLAVTKASYQDPVYAGGMWQMALMWENLGNAPPYRDYACEITLVDGPNVYFRYVVPADKVQTKTWLPGKPFVMNLTVKLPTTVGTGKRALAVALFREDKPEDVNLRINLAHKTADAAKRALVGYVEVKSQGLLPTTPDEQSTPVEAVPVVSFPEIDKLLAANGYADALAAVQKEQAAARDDAKKSLEILKSKAERGAKLTGLVVAGGAKLKGRRITVDIAGMRAQAKIESVSAEGLKVDAAGIPADVAWKEISQYVLCGLARDAMDNTPQNHLLIAKFLLDIGRKDEAVKELEPLFKVPEVAEEAKALMKGL
jgi:hypothetical protein